MRIEYDELLEKWVVWKVTGSVMEEVFFSTSKKDCEKYVRKNKKERRKQNARN